MTGYSELIDAETWAFIERTRSFYPPDAANLPIPRQRDIHDRMCRAFFAGYPDGVASETTDIVRPGHSIPVRIYRLAGRKPAALMLYFHGGGFVFGGLDSHDDICAEFCACTGFELVSVDYRLAPEHRHPAAFDDAMSAYEWAISRYTLPILLAGDGAGGNLTAAVCHATRGHKRHPAGQVLVYPGLGGDQSRGSYVIHADAPLLTLRDLHLHNRLRTGGEDRTGDITMSPLADGNFAYLPPTFIVTAECDPLSSDGEAYGERVAAEDGKAFWHEEPGLVHGFLRARHMVGRARSSFTRIADAMVVLGHGEWVW